MSTDSFTKGRDSVSQYSGSPTANKIFFVLLVILWIAAVAIAITSLFGVLPSQTYYAFIEFATAVVLLLYVSVMKRDPRLASYPPSPEDLFVWNAMKLSAVIALVAGFANMLVVGVVVFCFVGLAPAIHLLLAIGSILAIMNPAEPEGW